MAVVAGPGRGVFPGGIQVNDTGNSRPTFECFPADQTAATILITLGVLGISANVALMLVIFFSKQLRR